MLICRNNNVVLLISEDLMSYVDLFKQSQAMYKDSMTGLLKYTVEISSKSFLHSEFEAFFGEPHYPYLCHLVDFNK